MKRAYQVEGLSSDSSSESDFIDDDLGGAKRASKKKANSAKKKAGVLDYEALLRHGYKSGPSVLRVPPPREVSNKAPDWSWSNGKEHTPANVEIEESQEEREKTRAAITQGEQLAGAHTRKEKNASFSQKEKRKRELGQASRGKNYVEEQKRLLRESGIYSGFDS